MTFGGNEMGLFKNFFKKDKDNKKDKSNETEKVFQSEMSHKSAEEKNIAENKKDKDPLAENQEKAEHVSTSNDMLDEVNSRESTIFLGENTEDRINNTKKSEDRFRVDPKLSKSTEDINTNDMGKRVSNGTKAEKNNTLETKEENNTLDLSIKLVEEKNIIGSKKLIDAGNNVNATDNKTAHSNNKYYTLNRQDKDKKLIEIINQENITSNDIINIELLLNAGADVNVVDKRGYTPLQHLTGMESLDKEENMASSTKIQLLTMLLEAGATTYAPTEGGFTPLHYIACQMKFNQEILNAMRLIINAGADVNAVDEVGYTPLYYMAEEQELTPIHIEAMRLLIDSGASMDKLDDEIKNKVVIGLPEKTHSKSNKTPSPVIRKVAGPNTDKAKILIGAISNGVNTSKCDSGIDSNDSRMASMRQENEHPKAEARMREERLEAEMRAAVETTYYEPQIYTVEEIAISGDEVVDWKFSDT